MSTEPDRGEERSAGRLASERFGRFDGSESNKVETLESLGVLGMSTLLSFYRLSAASLYWLVPIEMKQYPHTF
jgi:hypothetical protein